MVVLKLLVFCASVRGNLTDIRVPSVKTKKNLQMWRSTVRGGKMEKKISNLVNFHPDLQQHDKTVRTVCWCSNVSLQYECI